MVQVVETDGVAGALVIVVDAMVLLLVALLVEIRDDVDETV